PRLSIPSEYVHLFGDEEAIWLDAHRHQYGGRGMPQTFDITAVQNDSEKGAQLAVVYDATGRPAVGVKIEITAETAMRRDSIILSSITLGAEGKLKIPTVRTPAPNKF